MQQAAIFTGKWTTRMTTTIDIRELPDRFAELVAQAGTGMHVIVTESGTPKAVLAPLPPVPKQRIPGLHAGAIQIAPDFDAPLPDEFWTGQP